VATVKNFDISGYLNNTLALSTHMRINSATLAEKRFRTRYEGILLGAWRIEVSLDKRRVHSFMINQLELDLGSKIVPLEEQNSSLGVSPLISAGKDAMKVLERNYGDGTIPTTTTGKGDVVPIVYLLGKEYWHGKGRKPRWMCDYEDKGGNLADIKIEIKDVCK
jgi:hypothetical protein